MKAAVLYGIGDLRFEEVQRPVRETGEVLLKIRASGICGSDIPRVFTKGTYNFPTIPGHEFAGEIVEADKPELAGKKAAVFPLLPCRKCYACSIGEYAQCENYDYYGSRRDGAFAEYLAVKEWNLIFLPEEVSFEEGAMCEPASVARHAVLNAAVKEGDSVAIYGAGPIGLMLGQWARAFGASKVYLSDIDKAKLDFAAGLGFEVLETQGEHGGQNAEIKTDVVIEGAGVSAALENCFKTAKNFGRVVLMGNPAGDMHISQKAYWEILRKQLTVKGTWNSSYNDKENDWKESIKAIKDGKIKVKELITHRVRLDECNKAFEMMRDKTEFFNKVMFII